MSRPDACETGGADGHLPFGDSPAFTEPWQAEAFALVVLLNRQGLFEWGEWAEVFGAELQRPYAADDASDYYHHWLTALEKLLDRKQLAESEAVRSLASAWRRAARATPHGTPVSLDNDPERSSIWQQR